ncbi:MAG: hypothetical protein ACRD2A_18065 [Vicinamibacterales bacterium]
MRAFLLLSCLLLLAGCRESPTSPTVPLNSEFVLVVGGAASIDGASMTIRFNGVTGDSRCPADAVCVQGGDAIVSLTVTSTEGSRNHELHTGDMRPVRHGDITIALVQLVPYPFSSGAIQPGDYRATLRATR